MIIKASQLREEFYLAFECTDHGDLQTYLINNYLKWECKHTKNVVVKGDNNTQFGIRAVITGFKLSKVVSHHSILIQPIESTNYNSLWWWWCFGKKNFMDPYISFGEIYKDSSDIYRLGIILWVISRNGYITSGVEYKKPVAGSTCSYVALYNSCWVWNLDERPDINRVYELIHEDGIVLGENRPDINMKIILYQ
ncbi:5619_t:CDS:2, partial [Dentiscutata erythropus]